MRIRESESAEQAAAKRLQEGDRVSLDALMKPASNDAMIFTEVSNYVNKSSNEGAECIKPVDEVDSSV